MLRRLDSNDPSALAEALAQALPADPFVEVTVVTPSRGFERWLERRLVRLRGVVANVRFASVEAWLAPSASARERVALARRLLDILVSEDERLPRELAGYLAATVPSARDRVKLDLATRLASLFTELAVTRPDWLESFRRGVLPSEFDDLTEADRSVARWQASLVQHCLPVGAVWMDHLAREPTRDAHVFLPRALPPAVLRAIVRAADTSDVTLYCANPCAEFWGDAGDGLDVDSGLLASFGKALREHIAVLDELTGYDRHEAFAPGSRGTRLDDLRGSLLERRPCLQGAPDGTIRIVRASSVRREVEAVKQAIWALVGAGQATFDRIAVYVPVRSGAVYLSHFEAVFGEKGFEAPDSVPWSGDRLGAHGRVVEAMTRLTRLLERAPTRREILGVLAHPLVACELDEVTVSLLVSLTVRVGIIRGRDARDLAGTYAEDSAGEALHFDQGLSRLALEWARDLEGRLPQEAVLEATRVMRALLSDHAAMQAPRTLRSWGRDLAVIARGWIHPTDAQEQRELSRVVEVLERLDEGGAEASTSAAIAMPLVASLLEELTTPAGDGGGRGVLVTTLVAGGEPPRPVSFVLGLGEGEFPAPLRDPGFDLRRRRPRRGDCGEDDLDRAAFLEVLAGVRDRLWLSYVANDLESGDPLEASSVLRRVRELVPGVDELHLPTFRDDPDSARRIAPGPEVEFARAALPASELEANARAMGERERSTWTDVPEVQALRWLTETPLKAEQLGLSPLPPCAESRARPLFLRDLERFLACPVQGRASRSLPRALDRVEGGRDEEGLDADHATLGSIAREAFVEALATDGPMTSECMLSALDAAIQRARQEGRFPLGVLGAEPRDALRKLVVEGWFRGLARHAGANARGRSVRFGSVRHVRNTTTSEARPAIELGAHRIEGVTLLRTPSGDLVLPLTSAPRSDARDLVQRIEALRAFVHHAALTLGGDGEVPRRLVLLEPDRVFVASMGVLRRTQVERWFASLAEDLEREDDPVFFPVEAVLRATLGRRGANPIAELPRALEAVRADGGGSSVRGPVRRVVEFPSPGEADLPKLINRRFGLFLAAPTIFTELTRG